MHNAHDNNSPSNSEIRSYHRNRYGIYVASLIGSIIIHIAFAYVVGLIIEWRSASYEITIAWSNDPLTGFGMMGSAFDEVDYADNSEALDKIEELAEDENPFDEPEPDVEPDLDASSVEAPPEPEPEPEPTLAENGDTTATTPDNKPAHDLTHDKARFAALKNDVAGMPDLHVLAPGNAKLIVLLRNDRIKGSRFEDSVRRLYKSFPDYRFTLGTSDVDPVNDINAMLVATANPALYAETFLVVSHNIPQEKLKKAVVDSFPTEIKWETYDNHPIATPNSNDGKYSPRSGIYKRSVYLPSDNTILFLKPEVLPTLNVPHMDAIVSTRNEDINAPEQAQTFLQSLGAITTSDSPSMPMLFFALQGIQDLSFGPSFPKFDPPRIIQASLSTDSNPRLNLAATFESPEKAKEFNDVWPDILKGASSLGIPGIGGLLAGLSIAPEGNQVLITGELNGNLISLVLMFASRQLQNS